MNKISIGIITLAVFTSIAVSFAIRHRSAVSLRERAEFLNDQAETLSNLTAENQRLSALAEKLASAAPLSKDQLTELLRLRNQAGQLRQALAEKPRLQATNAQLRALESESERQLAEAQRAPNYWPKDQLTEVGFFTPEAAMKSMLWAMSSGDISLWRSNCTPEAVAGREAEWRRHGTTEAEQEAEMKAMGAALTAGSAGFHILDQQRKSPDEAILRLSFDGEGAVRTFVLKKVGNEWKFHEFIPGGQEKSGQ